MLHHRSFLIRYRVKISSLKTHLCRARTRTCTRTHTCTHTAGCVPGEAGWQVGGREDLSPRAGGVARPDRAAQTGGAAAGEGSNEWGLPRVVACFTLVLLLVLIVRTKLGDFR